MEVMVVHPTAPLRAHDSLRSSNTLAESVFWLPATNCASAGAGRGSDLEAARSLYPVRG